MKILLAICCTLFTGLVSADLFSFTKSLPSTQVSVTKPKTATSYPSSVTSNASAKKVNINTSDVQMLTNLKGIGAKKAQAIINYRQNHGPFNSLAQFELVPGIGPSLIEKNKDIIVFK